MKLACLVERDGQRQWEEGVRQAAWLFDDHYRFDYNGPWPPYNFADIDLRLRLTPMFLLDDLLLAPIKGLAAVCQKVHEAAEEDLEAQEKAVLADLAELHHLLDAGQISDDDFNVREGDCWTGWTRAGRPRSGSGRVRSRPGRRPWTMSLPSRRKCRRRRKPTPRCWSCSTACSTRAWCSAGDVTITVADIELIYLRLQLMLSSAETAGRRDGSPPDPIGTGDRRDV